MKNSELQPNGFKTLLSVLKWIVRPKQWIGQEFKYYGKMRKVISETPDSVYLEDIEHPVNKRNFKKYNAATR